MRKQAILAFVFFLLLSVASKADLVHLKEGKVVEGEVISETESKVTIRLPMGRHGDIVYTIDRTKIDKIEEAPVSYDFFNEEDQSSVPTVVEGNEFSLDNIIKKVLTVFKGGKGKGQEDASDEFLEKIGAYIFASGLIGVIANFILFFLAVSAFNAFRRDPATIARSIQKVSGIGIFMRWLFFSGGLMLVTLNRSGSFDFTGSGIVPILLLAVILYETAGAIYLLFFRKAYVTFLSEGRTINLIAVKLPIACEFTLFTYLILMDLFVTLI